MRVVMLACLVACGPDPSGGKDDPCVAGDEPTLRVGEGQDVYTPLDDGDPVELVHGPQGGYHVELGFEATHLDAEELVSGLVVATIDGETVASIAPWVELTCDGDALRSVGTLLVFRDGLLPEDLHDQPLHLAAELRDGAGTVVTDALEVVVHDPLLAP